LTEQRGSIDDFLFLQALFKKSTVNWFPENTAANWVVWNGLWQVIGFLSR